MSFFSRSLNSDEFEQLNKKLISAISEIENIKAKIEALNTNQNSLRGLINRKIGGEAKQEEDFNTGFPFK
jgi:hypothetical protein